MNCRSDFWSTLARIKAFGGVAACTKTLLPPRLNLGLLRLAGSTPKRNLRWNDLTELTLLEKLQPPDLPVKLGDRFKLMDDSMHAHRRTFRLLPYLMRP